MKKRLAIIVLTSLLSALFVNVMPVFADAEVEDAVNDDLKIYYSEPIGAGEKVYHITACQKIPATSPIVCTKKLQEMGGRNRLGRQCDNVSDVGNKIKGCLTDVETLDASGHRAVDIRGYLHKEADGGCSDKPIKQGYKYGKLYAHLADENLPDDVTPATSFSDSMITGTEVSHNDREPEPGPDDHYIVKPMYRAGLCATWDVVEGNKRELSKGAKEILDSLKGKDPPVDLTQVQTGLMEGGCNNSVHTDKLDSEPSGSCSYVERITGASGSGILSAYIGAIYKWATGIVGIIAVLTMVYSGIQISVAGGNTSLVEEAHANILKALAGLAILFLAGLILYTINPTFFVAG